MSKVVSSGSFLALMLLVLFPTALLKAQSQPMPTEIDSVGFGASSQDIRTSVSVLINVSGVGLVPNTPYGQGYITVRYIPEFQGGTPYEVACSAAVANSGSSCLWYIDPPGEYLVQVHYSGVYDYDTGTYIYAPCDSEIYDVVGGPGYATGYPR